MLRRATISRSRRGRRPRNALVTAALLSIVAATSSCVVSTTPTLFQDPNQCNPFFLADQALPATSTIGSFDPAGTGKQQFEATVPLSSCNLTQSYQAQVFIDGSSTPAPYIIDDPNAPGGTRTVTVFDYASNGTATRDILFRLQVVAVPSFTERCHRIDLYVSGQFREPKVPLRAGDLAVIGWFIDVTNDTTGHGVLTCNTSP